MKRWDGLADQFIRGLPGTGAQEWDRGGDATGVGSLGELAEAGRDSGDTPLNY